MGKTSVLGQVQGSKAEDVLKLLPGLGNKDSMQPSFLGNKSLRWAVKGGNAAFPANLGSS